MNNLDLAQRRVLLPCHSLSQSRHCNFFGQEKVLGLIDDTLLRSSSPGNAHLRSFALCGMSGLGKTEIAVHYIHTRKNQFEAIFWIDSDSREKLDAGFQDIAIKLGLQDDVVVLNDDPAATREVVQAWLANPARQLALGLPEQRTDVNWLIVFDNADEPDILSDFWPSKSSGAILVTSRRPLATQASYTGSSGIDLSPMPSEEAGRLLQKTADLESDPGCLDTCISIAERLGGLPLAIVQMAHQIRHKHLSLTKFVEYYDQDTGKFHEASIPGLTKQQTVASIWNIEALPLPAVALLRVLSVLDSDVTYEDVLTSGAGKVALEHYPKTKDDYVEAREALVKSSLVIRDWGASGRLQCCRGPCIRCVGVFG